MKLAHLIAGPDWKVRQRGCREIPEFTEALHPALRWIASDQRGIDRPDRHARHPIERHLPVITRLIDPGLIRAARTAALQDKRAAIGPRQWFGICTATGTGVATRLLHDNIHWQLLMGSDQNKRTHGRAA